MDYKNDFYEIKFYSIGGQGAYTTGQMLSTAISKSNEDLKVAMFASYGSEKKGAPVNVFIRFKETEEKITNYSPVKRPNISVVFREQLIDMFNVLEGIKDDGILLVDTDLSAQELVDMYKLDADKVVAINATKIANDNKAKTNTVMFGALIKIMGLPNLNESSFKTEIESKLAYKFPHLVESNITACADGFEQANITETTPNKEGSKDAKPKTLGYENQPLGGAILGPNALLINRKSSREGFVPKFNKEACINCTKCDTVCPDDCFVWKEEVGRRDRIEMNLQGIDYQYCKGCLKCVKTCPTDALSIVEETREFADQNSVKKEYDYIGGK